MMGFEPTNTGTTIRGLNRLATPALRMNLTILAKGGQNLKLFCSPRYFCFD